MEQTDVQGIQDPMAQNKVNTLLNNSLEDLPRRTDLDAVGRELQEAVNLGDSENSRRVLNKTTQLVTLPETSIRGLREVRTIMSSADIGRQVRSTSRKVQEELDAQERQLGRETLGGVEGFTRGVSARPVGNTGQSTQDDAATWETLNRARDAFQSQTDNRPDGLTVPDVEEIPFDIPLQPPALKREISDRVRRALEAGKAKPSGAAEEPTPPSSRSSSSLSASLSAKSALGEEEDSDVEEPVVKKFRPMPEGLRQVFNKEFLTKYGKSTALITEDQKGGSLGELDGLFWRPAFDYMRGGKIKVVELGDISRAYKLLLKLFGDDAPEGITEKDLPPSSGTKEDRLAGFNIKVMDKLRDHIIPWAENLQKQKPSGSGIRGRGVVQNQTYPLGKYLIKGKQLNNDIVNIKTRTNQSLKKFPATKVSSNMGKIIRVIAGGGVPAFDDMNQLTQTEKSYLHKIAKETDLIGRFSIPTPDKTKEDKEKDEFDLLKGQILSGNDNAELVKKFKSLLIRLATRGDLPKGECREILMDLVAMGY